MEKSFKSIGAARRLHQTATGVLLRTRTEELEITALKEDLIRVTMRRQSQPRKSAVSNAEIPSCAIVRHDLAAVDVEITESPTDVNLITQKVRVHISKSPIRIGFHRPDGIHANSEKIR
mgnify:CR=1 FL=1